MSDEIRTVSKVVVFFDIVSSTSILEDLIAGDHVIKWRNLLIHLKTYLSENTAKYRFEPYKFLGDGWILLFDETIEGAAMCKFLASLKARYDSAFRKRIKRVLKRTPPRIGLTFGVDAGSLVKVRMNDQEEYLGRPLNVAARLQSSINQKDDNPQGKVLCSKSAYRKLKLCHTKFSGKRVKRALKNIVGGNSFLAYKITL